MGSEMCIRDSYYSPGKKDNNGKLSFDQRVPDTGGCTFATTMSPTVILLPVGRPSRRPKGQIDFFMKFYFEPLLSLTWDMVRCELKRKLQIK